MIVADSNLIASCVLESAATESACNLRTSDAEWYVPRLWRYEVANILATMIKVRGLSADTATTILGTLSETLRPYEREPMAETVFALVAKHGITGYDAHFVALAQEMQCPLYTQDKELLEKFPGTAKPFCKSR